MNRLELLPGCDIIVFADRSEANQFCKANPAEKHLVWLEEECIRYLMASPEELRGIVEAKRLKPGVK